LRVTITAEFDNFPHSNERSGVVATQGPTFKKIQKSQIKWSELEMKERIGLTMRN
jgi:hypothetical protein